MAQLAPAQDTTRKREKNYSFSLMRFLAMLSLTTCHMFQQAGHEITANLLSTSVQLFLLMSGYLYAHKEFTEPGAMSAVSLHPQPDAQLEAYRTIIRQADMVLAVYDPASARGDDTDKAISCARELHRPMLMIHPDTLKTTYSCVEV